ncbi:hypothetical protein FWC31_03275 [Candidatus Saccharibacteria bacterium]|nr:hypothetical protein [Candidatus Saccharibacteria bacterium]
MKSACRLLTIIAIVLLPIFATPGINTTANAISGTDLIQVTSPGVIDIVKFSGVGSEDLGSHLTRSSRVKLYLRVVGIGDIKIIDHNGNILYEYHKTHAAVEDLYPEVTLVGGVGRYILTAIHTGTEIDDVARATLVVDYDTIGVPGTGFLVYIGGYAVPVINVFWAPVVVVAAIIYIRHRAHRRARDGECSNSSL